MKHILFKILSVCTILALFCSCTEEDQLNYNLLSPEIKLCLSGFVCPDSTYIVLSFNRITKPDTSSIRDWQLITGSDASVTMYENDLFFDSLTLKNHLVKQWPDTIGYLENYYLSTKKTSAGKRYTVRAVHKGYTAISAETILPALVPILSVDSASSYHQMAGIMFTTFHFSFQDPASTANYYLISEPKVFSNNLTNDSLYYAGVQLTTNIIYEIENNDGDLYRVDRPTFSDKLIQGKKTSIESTLFNWHNIHIDSIQFYLYTINDDYYKYNSSLYQKAISEYDANNEPVLVYSNVTNGYGIFVGYNKSTYTLGIK